MICITFFILFFSRSVAKDTGDEKDPVLARPTTLFDSVTPETSSEAKEAITSPCDSVSSKNSSHSETPSDGSKESPVLSPGSPGGLDVKSLLSAVGDVSDAARRERINR